MTAEAILSFLKFGGPIVGLASAVWSTTQKITYEGADGVKRLTLQGRVLIGIIVASTLISILALGFETVIARQQRIEAAELRTAEVQKAARKEQQAKDDAASAVQAEALARLEAEAKQQKSFLEQSILITTSAADQQRRDAQIAQQIAREANARLGDAQQIFAQFDLVNYPLQKLEATAEIELELSGQDLTDLWAYLEGPHDLEANRRDRYNPAVKSIYFTPRELAFGGRSRRFIDYSTTGTEVRLRFVPTDADEEANVGEGIPSIVLRVARIEAELPERKLTVYYAGEYAGVEGLRIAGKRVSLANFKKLAPILTIARSGMRVLGARPPDILQESSVLLNGIEWFAGSPNLSIRGEDRNNYTLLPAQKR